MVASLTEVSLIDIVPLNEWRMPTLTVLALATPPGAAELPLDAAGAAPRGEQADRRRVATSPTTSASGKDRDELEGLDRS